MNTKFIAKYISMRKKFIHMWWVIGLLVVLLIISLCLGIYERVVCANTIIDLVSFISSMLSIVLSVFAIFYSYFTSIESSQQWGDIKTCVKEMKESTNSIKENNRQLLYTMIQISGTVKSTESLLKSSSSTTVTNQTSIENLDSLKKVSNSSLKQLKDSDGTNT